MSELREKIVEKIAGNSKKVILVEVKDDGFMGKNSGKYMFPGKWLNSSDKKVVKNMRMKYGSTV